MNLYQTRGEPSIGSGQSLIVHLPIDLRPHELFGDDCIAYRPILFLVNAAGTVRHPAFGSIFENVFVTLALACISRTTVRTGWRFGHLVTLRTHW
jgi:hypothetical protein